MTVIEAFTFAPVVMLLLAFTAVAPAQTSGPLASFSFNDGDGAGRFGPGLVFSGSAVGRPLPVAGLSNAFTFESWINPSAFAWSDIWKQRPETPGNPIYTLCTTPTGANLLCRVPGRQQLSDLYGADAVAEYMDACRRDVRRIADSHLLQRG